MRRGQAAFKALVFLGLCDTVFATQSLRHSNTISSSSSTETLEIGRWRLKACRCGGEERMS